MCILCTQPPIAKLYRRDSVHAPFMLLLTSHTQETKALISLNNKDIVRLSKPYLNASLMRTRENFMFISLMSDSHLSILDGFNLG